MARTFSYILFFVVLSTSTLLAQVKNPGFHFNDFIAEKRIDILYNDTLLTSYMYGDSLMKPVLFPIKTRTSTTVTRGFPIHPREGERVDHPHHIGLWFNYEYVNGLDFWNNSTAIPYKDRAKYGSIIHDGIVRTLPGDDKGELEVTARWVDHSGKILLRENTVYRFRILDRNFVIDRVTTLNALDEDVFFKDVKDGLLGIRVARELEHPSDEATVYVDHHGNATTVAAISKKDVTGEYTSSEGLKGNDVWGTRGRWVQLSGLINGKRISVIIFDHPKNPGYPTYWHARGYGLFAANPFGQEIFSKGKEKLNFKLEKKTSVTFRYRVVVREGMQLTTRDFETLESF
ncbi:DUF6807 domain-containing protein [Pseudochryseolinea flava]|uniref:Methane oxygenase PmoA n=1 Tax=Pseudochryseolinea flava TaxID=2059302 RepID=A0A364Y7A6_9BACT|nr:PmoA family protein [Pseudochryseolinea flava]RAW02994.1 hypothetical protein DQQ10_02515 [Pseudochryseolinea flava]